MSTQVQFDNVSKSYRLGSGRTTLREAISSALAVALPGPKPSDQALREEIWALRNVSFEVEPGETLGLIGPNGSGKTTVLKLLSGVTRPTSGSVNVNGRLAALIELGAGFHPDLTGRENVYLNGVILGLTRREIHTRFDSIVEFAGLHRFIDTPVKRYSSGMYVRLGFSVAAHSAPEVLLVDEVLAVGDIAFQNKSFARIQSFREHGASIVLVSHNLSAIAALCDRAVWLNQGRVARLGQPNDVIEAYLEDYDCRQREELADDLVREDIGTGDMRITRVVLFDHKGRETSQFQFRDDVGVRVHYLATELVRRPRFMISVTSQAGALFGANMLFDGQCPETLEGEGTIECVFRSVSLLPGNYQIMGGVRGSDGVLHIVRPRQWATFGIASPISDYGFDGEFGTAVSRVSTPIVVPYEWRFGSPAKHFVYDPERSLPRAEDEVSAVDNGGENGLG